ncbi:MAG: hypothetical protein THHGLFOP_000885, partial [Candidatus Fervidibacter sp.]
MRRNWLPVVCLIAFVLAVTAWRAMTFAPTPQPVTLGLVDMQK